MRHWSLSVAWLGRRGPEIGARVEQPSKHSKHQGPCSALLQRRTKLPLTQYRTLPSRMTACCHGDTHTHDVDWEWSKPESLCRINRGGLAMLPLGPATANDNARGLRAAGMANWLTWELSGALSGRCVVPPVAPARDAMPSHGGGESGTACRTQGERHHHHHHHQVAVIKSPWSKTTRASTSATGNMKTLELAVFIRRDANIQSVSTVSIPSAVPDPHPPISTRSVACPLWP